MQKQLLYFLRFVHKNSSSNQTTVFSWAQRWSVQIADVLMYFYFDLEPSLNEVLSWNILLLSRIHAAVNLHRALDLQLQNSSKASTPANRSSQWQLQFRCCILFRQLLLYCSDSKEPVVMKVALISWRWYLTTTWNQHNCADLKVWICALQSFFPSFTILLIVQRDCTHESYFLETSQLFQKHFMPSIVLKCILNCSCIYLLYDLYRAATICLCVEDAVFFHGKGWQRTFTCMQPRTSTSAKLKGEGEKNNRFPMDWQQMKNKFLKNDNIVCMYVIPVNLQKLYHEKVHF